jgi:hypothetical protein
MVQVHVHNHIAGEAVFVINIVQIRFKRTLFTVEVNEPAAICTYPKVMELVFSKAINIAKTDTRWVREVVRIMRKLNNVTVVIADASFVSANPDNVGIILINNYRGVLGNSFIIIFPVKQVGDGKISFVKNIYAAMVGRNPYMVFILLNYVRYYIGIEVRITCSLINMPANILALVKVVNTR